MDESSISALSSALRGESETDVPNDESVQIPFKTFGEFLYDGELDAAVFDYVCQYLVSAKPAIPLTIQHWLAKETLSRLTEDSFDTFAAAPIDDENGALHERWCVEKVARAAISTALRLSRSLADDDSRLRNLVQQADALHPVSVHAVRGTRRKMEDRHTIIQDMRLLKPDLSKPFAYYSIFDGHGGCDAAQYAALHLHWHLLADLHRLQDDPAAALADAFTSTDAKFLEKADLENLNSGATGLVLLVDREESVLHIAWAGDSQCWLFGGYADGKPRQLMDPHRPDREDEKARIESLGGTVFFLGTWRVNGTLAVSRAIGDRHHKPCVSAEAEVKSWSCEDAHYLVMACDGLWDSLTPEEVQKIVYDCQSSAMSKDSESDGGWWRDVARQLVEAASENGSSDNISVIVVFLTTRERFLPPAAVDPAGDDGGGGGDGDFHQRQSSEEM